MKIVEAISQGVMTNRFPFDGGYATWNELVNLIMGEPPRVPALEVGIRLKDIEDLSNRWHEFRSKVLARTPAMFDTLEGWPVASAEEFAIRLSRLPLITSNDRTLLDKLCATSGRKLARTIHRRLGCDSMSGDEAVGSA